MKTKEYNHKNLFDCKIVYSPKRKRSLCISIKPEGVFVRVPLWAFDKEIFNFIEQKEKVVLKNLKRLSEIKALKQKPLYERESLHFLGDEYFLKISKSKLLKKSGFCEIREDYFIVNLPHIEEEGGFDQKLEKIVKSWYKKRALEIFNERTEYLANLHNFEYKKIQIREQKTLWGSCTQENNLSFNWKVVQCHIDVVDYLIIHELVHTLHKNHSRKFWSEVEKILPNYKYLKKCLKEMQKFSI